MNFANGHPSAASGKTRDAGSRRILEEPAQAQRDAVREAVESVIASSEHGINMIKCEEEDEVIAMTEQEVTVTVAMDSGSVDNVIHPREAPEDVEPEPNLTDKHFVGANNSRIHKYGSCKTKLKSRHGTVGCGWSLADVSRPLHSVGKVTGPEDGPPKQDVLFNNKKCVVVPPGIVDEILKRIKPLSEYKRSGNLYLGEFTMSSFPRQGQKA